MRTETKDLSSVVKQYVVNRPSQICKKHGKAEISLRRTIKPGQKVEVVSMRNAIFMGMPLTTVTFNKSINVYELRDRCGVWMTDEPQELLQLHEFVRSARGHVLVGGLGLGVAAHFAALKASVKSVTVVEINQDIIALRPPSNEKIKIVHGDLFEYVKTIRHGQYQSCFFDIWRSTGEWTWQTMVVPLRRLVGNNIPRTRLFCWNEREMTGQVANALFRAADIDEGMIRGRASNQHWWPFRLAVKHLRPSSRINAHIDFKELLSIESENKEDPEIQAMAQIYLNYVGTPLWENLFGKAWDESERWLKTDYHTKKEQCAESALPTTCVTA